MNETDLSNKIATTKDKLWNDKNLSDSEAGELVTQVIDDIIALNEIKPEDKFVFTTPYEQYKEKAGQKGKVISITTSPEKVHWESAPLYLVEFEDGSRIEAHAEEIKPELILKNKANS